MAPGATFAPVPGGGAPAPGSTASSGASSPIVLDALLFLLITVAILLLLLVRRGLISPMILTLPTLSSMPPLVRFPLGLLLIQITDPSSTFQFLFILSTWLPPLFEGLGAPIEFMVVRRSF